ncbi:Serine/threonine-protein kinase par-1 [Tolypocladium ophioglossoides CBS 100239]|uniref:non-specific serine/threonine protein kinase n=1 Tax=Tolypocladium ophioglossoides (strain CBS 100239) TaxID=1163406 RepID=A0A0L0NCI7_TOLOC|nr:Serine/threonine-protein kinase par-1 [Tolypocladium ophioglossoides CBS 100239]
MENADIIARVYPVPHVKKFATEAIERSARCVFPNPEFEPTVEYGRYDRAPTEPPEDDNDLDMSYLEIKFSDIPRTSHGIVFGCDPDSDVVLPNLKGISKHHFSLIFDDANRLIVRDWGSLLGTEVTYDGEGHGKRSNFRWIVGGDRNPKEKTSILIKVHGTIEFQVVAAHHDLKSAEYIARVHRFRQGTATAEDLFRDLDLPQRPDTELPTGAHTPGRGEIYLRKKIGEGSFGVVTHFWHVSDGSEYALKEPTARAIRKRAVNHDVWCKEARLMGQISHPHIVRLFKANFTPHPQLFLAYAPGGSLEDQEYTTADETISILQQCLSALAYLHESKPPIVHRDIKPANILVQHRFPGDIYVLFGDFGIARDSYELSTICGTQLYLAPEVYLEWQTIQSNAKTRKKYTPAVDVWSLGVVVYELICGLPRYKSSYRDRGTVWCDKLVEAFLKHLERRPDALGQFLLNNMVVISPESRSSARDCYELAALLPSAAEGGCSTPRPAQRALEDEQTTFRNGPTRYDVDDDVDYQGTTVHLPMAYAGGYTAKSSEGEFVRSEAPPPDTLPSISRKTLKRTATFEAPSLPSSSSPRRTTKRREDRTRRRGSVSAQHPELAQFLEDYSSDPFDPLYVGSSLASWAGEKESGSCTGQSSHNSTMQQLENADPQGDDGPGVVPPPNMSSIIPRSPWEGWYPENEEPDSGISDTDERHMAALLLQAINQEVRQ